MSTFVREHGSLNLTGSEMQPDFSAVFFDSLKAFRCAPQRFASIDIFGPSHYLSHKGCCSNQYEDLIIVALLVEYDTTLSSLVSCVRVGFNAEHVLSDLKLASYDRTLIGSGV
ncbi:uncharacterized protein MEPE_04175 [Melanopsichium pennsylvanicum]|uniref:Uncharacterized protein n=1 Tax=Melanopsichium pennsylvanicum TaxID=63383 RepID=A0AAJ4XPD2_9BASI|nr:uncharacterized protein MEPE_04175 [Melanopsichium pennsylvanicum]